MKRIIIAVILSFIAFPVMAGDTDKARDALTDLTGVSVERYVDENHPNLKNYVNKDVVSVLGFIAHQRIELENDGTYLSYDHKKERITLGFRFTF